MALCPFCRLHTFQLGDQFCGLCGKPLCRLVVEQGLYVELPEEPKTGLVTQELLVRNAGWSILTLRLRDSVDSAVRLRTREQALLQLDPGVEATRLLFEVDLSKVTRRKNKVCCVDFESSDPRLARGSLRFGFPTPAAIAPSTSPASSRTRTAPATSPRRARKRASFRPSFRRSSAGKSSAHFASRKPRRSG